LKILSSWIIKGQAFLGAQANRRGALDIVEISDLVYDAPLCVDKSGGGAMLAMTDDVRLGRPGIGQALCAEGRVILAIMLRDVRTRFFGSALGYLVAIAWPLVHMAILMAMFIATGRLAPYGSSLTLFFATGLVPFMSFSYMSRFTMISLVMNKPLLNFPAVKMFDVLMGRGILELLCSCLVAILLLTILWLGGVDVAPQNLVQAAYALGASLLLGLGFGVINAVIAVGMPSWLTGYSLVIVLVWITSGIMFVPDALPESLKEIVALNPLLHGVEWMRSAYYEAYSTNVLDKAYILCWGAGSLAVGLVSERFLRGFLLKG
jgi:capsular polysaccharide transport system permease protein